MGIALSFFAFVAVIFGTIAMGLLKDECSLWLPRLSAAIVSFASSRIPEKLREQYAEEWQADILEYPGKISQLVRALTILLASEKMLVLTEEQANQRLEICDDVVNLVCLPAVLMMPISYVFGTVAEVGFIVFIGTTPIYATVFATKALTFIALNRGKQHVED